MKEILFGAAYYDEYMPYDRLDKDIDMMKKAGINTVRGAPASPRMGCLTFLMWSVLWMPWRKPESR